jgi:chromate transport protein ChrA
MAKVSQEFHQARIDGALAAFAYWTLPSSYLMVMLVACITSLAFPSSRRIVSIGVSAA